jgi:hypothetical protein
MGSVKSLFESQWMTNHTMKNIKDVLDISSKIWFQTADPAFRNNNVFKNIDTGQIMNWDKTISGGQITQVNNSHDITSLISFKQQWQQLSQELSFTPDIMQGKNMPSGTAYRQAAIIQQESYSNFKPMLQNKGLHIERMFREHITPYLLKKMDTTEEITATLNDYGIDKIDKMFIDNEAANRFNRKAVEAVLNNKQLPDFETERRSVEQEVSQAVQRFIKPSDIPSKTWKKVIGEFEGDIVYEITDENTEKQAVLETLSTVLQTIVSNPAVLQDKNARLLFNKILEETSAISPIELKEAQVAPAMPIVSGQQVGVGANNNQINVK